ncbi:MAG TPA: CarD family transcriptional regulator [Acidimicrobiia bacterium]|nr:CarD family transcriptional regulator [Acidimicrobiia bacterium]
MATKKTPATEKPAAAASKKAAVAKSATKTAAAKKSTAGKPAAKKPAAAAKPAASKKTTAAKKPAAKKPAAAAKPAASKKPAAKKTASAPTPAAKQAAVAEAAGKTAAPRRRKKASPFSVGDKVVHPHHGAAVITKKTKLEVAGEKRDYFVLAIATDQLTVSVPIDNIEETIRPVISKAAAKRVFQLFKDDPQEAGSNWSRWYKVLNEKMTSGDIYQVAEVVRDLTFAQQTKGISPALKRMLSKARLTLTSELQFALAIDEEEATKRLDRALPKVEIEES